MFNFLKKNKIINLNPKLYTKVIYHSKINLISLIYFTDNYYYDALEFLQAANDANITTKLIRYNKDTDKESSSKKNEAKTPEDIQKQYNYIIVSGDNYYKLFNNINSISNKILLELTDATIYNYCSSSYYDDHINNGVLNQSKFKYKNVEPKYINKLIYKDNYMIDDINIIKSVVHSGLTKKDILDLIAVELKETNHIDRLIDLLDPYGSNFMTNFNKFKNDIEKIFGNISLEELQNYLIQPKYLDNVDIDDNITSNEIDKIFENQYDNNFSGAYDEELGFNYIDEISDEKIDDDTVRNYINSNKEQ